MTGPADEKPIADPRVPKARRALEPGGKRINPKMRHTIEVYLAESKGHIRQAMRNAMFGEGFKLVRDFASLADLQEGLRRGIPDLVVIDGHISESDLGATIGSVRDGKLGLNPFIPVIVTVWDPEANLVRSVIDGGTDDLLINPISPNLLLTRMETLAYQRKPFVVTSDYIGPDRRTDSRHSAETPLFEVPNTLREKSNGRWLDKNDVRQMVEGSLRQINEQRLRRYSYEIGFLANQIVPAWRENRMDEVFHANIDRLALVAEDIIYRISGTTFENVVERCETLVRVIAAIQRMLPIPDPKDMQLLKPLADSILLGFNPGKDSHLIAGEITEMIRRFDARVRARRAVSR